MILEIKKAHRRVAEIAEGFISFFFLLRGQKEKRTSQLKKSKLTLLISSNLRSEYID